MAKAPRETLDDFARAKLDALEAQALRRRLVETDRREGAIAFRDGRRLVSFCCNDYLNLSQNETVKRAAIEAPEPVPYLSVASTAAGLTAPFSERFT